MDGATVTPHATVVVARILHDEGGIADVGDGMGVTRFGQTPQWLAQYDLPIPATPADAAVNYDKWLRHERLSDVVEWDADVGYLVADWAVHSGTKVAVRSLQKALGVDTDGAIGPITIAAFAHHSASAVARSVLADRVEFLGSLLASTTTDRRKWARGWLNRLARQVRTLP